MKKQKFAMKKGQIIKAVLFMALIAGLIPYLPKRAQVSVTDVESAIEIPVEAVIDQSEPTQRNPVTGYRIKGAEPSIATTGSHNVFFGHEAGVNAIGQNNSDINRAYNKRLSAHIEATVIPSIRSSEEVRVKGNYNAAMGYRAETDHPSRTVDEVQKLSPLPKGTVFKKQDDCVCFDSFGRELNNCDLCEFMERDN